VCARHRVDGIVELLGVITSDQVVDVIRPLLDDIVRLSDRVRLVRTASSALPGIDLPGDDVDVLAKDRETVGRSKR
jgi:hypothetical protein